MVNMPYWAVKQPRNVLKAFWKHIKFRNLKPATRDIFVYSIQLSTYLFKRETCKFVYIQSHYRVYVSAHTYYLYSRFIFRQILFNVVCKAFSRVQIKVGA